MFDAVLFDCDGVLVDSEPITLGVLTQCLNATGWSLTQEECSRHFLGRAVKDQASLFLQMTGENLTESWLTQFRAKRDAALSANVKAIPGIHEFVEFANEHLNSKIACASGADRAKVELQLGKVDLMRWFKGKIFSGHEMPRSKPAPDVYLAAASYLNVDPKSCLVIEDTPTGVQAGISAGATVWAYLPRANEGRVQAEELINAGAQKIFTHMHELHEYMRAN
jgi:HAD superfamily hydrolase (TIGR01509 family)